MSRNEQHPTTRSELTRDAPLPRTSGRTVGEQRFLGIPVAPGIAIGPVFGSKEPVAAVVHHRIQAADIEAEITRLDGAIAQSLKQLAKLKHKLSVLPEEAQTEIAPLIDAYTHMLGPTRLTRGMRKRVREMLVSAETAVAEECESTAAQLMLAEDAEASEDERASHERRAEEVREIGRRLVRNLTRTAFRSFAEVPDGAVVISESLRPADAALLDPSRVAAVATEEGGSDGHTAIMLRALGLPTVLGAAGLSHRIRPGDTAIVDGSAGLVILNPAPETLARAREDQLSFAHERQKLARLRRLPAETRDGQIIQLHANIELPAELPMIKQAGASGIGLLRTEFLFMNRETLPDEAAQEAVYRLIITAMDGMPVTIRVLDWGGEKDIEALSNAGLVPEQDDANPALGMRGVRLLLRRPTLFETQLTAILRASMAGPVRVLIPMVTCVDEVRQARAIYDKVIRRMRRAAENLPSPLPPFGIMVETPGAALAADALAVEADFFAIGTNDLTMYTLAVDRAENSVAGLYDPLHPAVLRLIQFTTEAALRLDKPVSVCGEMASNPHYVPLLIGLGVRQFSMNAASLPRVKQVVRAISLDACRTLAAEVMHQTPADRIADLVAGFNSRYL
jgi:phosphoenolpyruvate-protein phosphotransferase